MDNYLGNMVDSDPWYILTRAEQLALQSVAVRRSNDNNVSGPLFSSSSLDFLGARAPL